MSPDKERSNLNMCKGAMSPSVIDFRNRAMGYLKISKLSLKELWRGW
jgi:hypothetical protein